MKQVHWQLPFADTNNTQYRIDIYAEGTPTGVKTLVGGSSPFTTDGNDSKNRFETLRSQSGHINILSDGTTTIDEIMPKHALDRPVRLVRVSDNAVLWQGFVSCEEHSQPYTKRTDVITLNLIGMIKAMESARIPESMLGFMEIRHVLRLMMIDFYTQVGIAGFVASYYVPVLSYDILNKYIDTSIFYERKENVDENNVTYYTIGATMSEVLNTICGYMGWCAYEYAQSIYMVDEGETLRRYSYQEANTNKYVLVSTIHSKSRMAVSSLEWTGTGHQRVTMQGAKSVEVVAKVASNDFGLKIPGFPTGELTRKLAQLYPFEQGSTSKEYSYYAQVYACMNTQGFSNVEFGYVRATENPAGTANLTTYRTTTMANVLSNMLVNPTAIVESTIVAAPKFVRALLTQSAQEFHAGAFFAKMASWKKIHTYTPSKDEYEPKDTTVVNVSGGGVVCTYPKVEDGIYCVFFPNAVIEGTTADRNRFSEASSAPILKIRNANAKYIYNGYINIQSDFNVLFTYPDYSLDAGSHIIRCMDGINARWSVGAALRIGDKYWNGSSWQDTACRFRLRFNNDNIENNWDKETLIPPTDGLIIPVTSAMRGEVELDIWPDASNIGGLQSNIMAEMFFKKLNVDFVYSGSDLQDDRSENKYYRLIEINGESAKFDNDESISTDIASDIGNKLSPSIIMDNATTPMRTIAYTTGAERPERHLLNRMYEQYKQVRSMLKLEVKPLSMPLPIVEFDGQDGEKYIPICESIDWQENRSTLKLIETI